MPKKADPIQSAILETKAQARVLELLQPHSPAARTRIMTAIYHLFQAEALVPGIIDRFNAGRSEPKPSPAQLQ